jgi:hypothetical protein
MAYIRFDITSEYTKKGKRSNASISRLRSDIDGLNTYELNKVLHALALADSAREIKSCFGSGVWRSDKPWISSDLWKS